MADFRKWIYAFAMMALLAGLTVPASAQATVPSCTAIAANNTIVRAEGFTEQVGDITISCQGGTPTTIGGTVPQVNIQVQLNTTITSRLLGTVKNTVTGSTVFNEALLIIDEPNSPQGIYNGPTTGSGFDINGHPHRILNCGEHGEDSSNAGPGVCAIKSTGNPEETYDGAYNQMATTTSPYHTCSSTSTYGCGRPNIFQGTQAAFFAQTDAVVFNGVPIDAPGTTTTRTLRFTNIRADATRFGAAAAFGFVPIVATISFSNNNALGLSNIQVTVASVQKGLSTSVSSDTGYLQCIAESGATGQSVTFVEGFDDAWKPANWSYFAGDDGIGDGGGHDNGTFVGGTNYQYNSTFYAPAYLAQDVPGALYYSETGFYYPGNSGSTVVEPTINPPPGQSNTNVAALLSGASLTNLRLSSASGSGIDQAGKADHGTRLAIQFANIPNGTTISVPTAVNLTNQNTGTITGVMVLTSTNANGAGAYTPPSSIGTSTYANVSNNLVVYEVLFDDPLSLEIATVQVAVSYTPQLGSDLPATAERQIGTAAGGFAPFYSGAPYNQPQGLTYDIPRFVFTGTPATLFDISRCACNLLFPWVASTGGFDTGIALANTSLDPGATAGFTAVPQSGTVTFWYYGSLTNGVAPPGPQTSAKVPNGSVLTYVLSSGAGSIYSTTNGITSNGMTNAAAGFAGYIIAQAQFQYCHAFAYISALGAGATSSGISEGYVALVLDKTNAQIHEGNLRRTVQTLSDQLEQ